MSATSDASRVSGRLVAAYNDFGFHLLSELVGEKSNQNVLISPLSTAVALTMTYNGAKGSTMQAMAATLQLADLSLPEVNKANAALTRMNDSLDPQVQFSMANSIWIRADTSPAADFVESTKTAFAGEAMSFDLGDPTAANVINKWVADSTREKIRELVTPEIVAQAILILLNAIYFKGNWTKEFDKADTREADFTLADGSHRPCLMMSQSGSYNYLENEKFQAISLPYGEGRVSMYLFLPRSPLPIGDLQRNLTIGNWHRWMSEFQKMEGRIVLPRFKVEYGKVLNQALINLGMGIAFSLKANFDGIGAGSPLFISNVIHKTFIEVNEEGAEAAATTAIVMVKGISPGQFTLVFDRPFFMAIRDDQTGAVLFMGFILDPTQA